MIPSVPLIQLKDLPEQLGENPWHFITEPNVWQFHQKNIEAVLGPIDPVMVPSGDAAKTLTQLEDTLGLLLDRGLNRQHQIIGFGGGAVCDFAAFVASVAMRGVDHFLIPSTLLAQVDAAHGGKTAVNLKQGKNLCGSFKWAKAIVIENIYLTTLPDEDLRNGNAEVYKTALIAGGQLYEDVVSSENLNTELLTRIADVKNQIVQQDPYEKAQRAYLNLGHTAGHAIEGQKSHNHGECVGMGMRYALRLGKRLGHLQDESLIAKTDEWLASNALPLNPANFSRGDFFKFMRNDKKQGNKGLKWIFVVKPGQMVTDRSVEKTDHDAILDELGW